jgi:hypothetical protein
VRIYRSKREVLRVQINDPGRSVKIPRGWSLQTPPSDDRRLS